MGMDERQARFVFELLAQEAGPNSAFTVATYVKSALETVDGTMLRKLVDLFLTLEEDQRSLLSFLSRSWVAA